MVPLYDFRDGTTWSRLAALEQCVITRACYNRDLSPVATMTGGLAPAYTRFPSDTIGAGEWKPGLLVYQSGGQWFINYAGTTNLNQFAGHIYGSLIRPVVGLETLNPFSWYGQPNYPWRAVADVDIETLASVIPFRTSAPVVNCWGHSYGAAIAQLIGYTLFQDWDIPVRIMTIASPKVWTKFLATPYPEHWWTLQSTDDLIPKTPPGADDLGVWPTFRQTQRFVDDVLARVNWVHYGEVVELFRDGALFEDPPVDEGYFGPYVKTTPLGAHLTSNYYGRIHNNIARGGS